MRKLVTIAAALLLSVAAFPQARPQKSNEDQPIKISTQLVQLDAVVTDKNGRVVKGLTKDDFELSERGKKQLISFFEYVDAGKGSQRAGAAAGLPSEQPSPQGPAERDIRRIFAFIVDDLTIRLEDLAYTRELLTNFVNTRMQPGDLVAIVRTVGGKGLLQQFTTDKNILLRAIASLRVVTHPLSLVGGIAGQQPLDVTALMGGEASAENLIAIDTSLLIDDTNQTLRSRMSLGTTSDVIDSMKQLPGRKSLVLISGGLPTMTAQFRPSAASNDGLPMTTAVQSGIMSASTFSAFLTRLADKATRAGVAIHTIDIRGLSAQVPVARFDDTPGKSAMGAANPQFGRLPDETLLGKSNVMDEQLGLRALSNDTGGIAVVNKNNFGEGLDKIIEANDGYYLLAYTPSDNEFKGDFRKIEVKIKNAQSGWKVYSRRGYFAREDKATAGPVTMQDQLLAAINSPLARREIDLDAMFLYKSVEQSKGAIDVNLTIESSKLQFDKVDDKQEATFDVAGFVFDELSKLRGGFSETIKVDLTPEELARIKGGGLAYSANTTLPPGAYQIRIAVRDNKNGHIGTLSQYVEVPDLSKGRLSASSLLLGTAPAGEMTAKPIPLAANKQISRKQDLRYAAFVYNAKTKDNRYQVRTQLFISQKGRVIYKEPEETVQMTDKNAPLVKIGQLVLSNVAPGRYALTLVITDPLADKKANTVTRGMDFVVVD